MLIVRCPLYRNLYESKLEADVTKTKAISRFSLLIGAFALSLVGLVGTTASASSPGSEPSAGAPVAAWQAWANSVNEATASTNWTSVAEDSGCQLIASKIVIVNDAALGIPSSVTLDGIALQLNCSADNPSASTNGISPEYQLSGIRLLEWGLGDKRI